MNSRIFMLALAGGTLLGVSCDPVVNSFRDTFRTAETRNDNHPEGWQSGGSPAKADPPVLREGPDSAGSAAAPRTPTVPEIPHLFSSESFLDSVQAQLENLPQLQGKPIRFYGEIHFYTYGTGSLELQIQDPDVPENLDKYSYSGGVWQRPEPVKTYASRDFRKGLMSLDRIRLSTALKVLELTREKAKSVEGIAPGHIYFYNSAVFNRREWSSYITGSRSDYDLAFDLDGNLKYFRRR